MADSRLAVITGTAQGLGYVTALQLGQTGYRLLLIDRQAPDAPLPILLT